MEEKYTSASGNLQLACQVHSYDYRQEGQWIGLIIRVIEGEDIYNLFKNKQNDLYVELSDTARNEVNALDAAYIYQTPQKWVFSKNEIFISVKFYLENKGQPFYYSFYQQSRC